MSVVAINNNFNFYSSIEEAKECYDLDQVIAKIASIKGRVALWIGRNANEALPVTEGTIWISGDLHFAHEPFSHDRLHLWMDFENEELCKKLEQLFDEVVIDQSTVKFFDEDFIKRFSRFLKPLPTSTFIFESCPYTDNSDMEIETPRNLYYTLLLPFTILEEEIEFDKKILGDYLNELGCTLDQLKDNNHIDFQNFVTYLGEERVKKMGREWKGAFKGYLFHELRNRTNLISPKDQAYIDAKEDTARHLREFFENVQYIKDKDYPYPTNFGNKEYYIASSPIAE